MEKSEAMALFYKVYEQTYTKILKFIVCRCHNIDDVNDILQETYFEFYKILCKKEIKDDHLDAYLYQIATHKIKKHFSLLQRIQSISFSSKDDMNQVADDIDIKQIFVNKEICQLIWNDLKKTEKLIVLQVFYLHYYEDMTLLEISQELKISESQVKNILYRTLKKIKAKWQKELNENV